jgi:SAM-dependent methyltransferase
MCRAYGLDYVFDACVLARENFEGSPASLGGIICGDSLRRCFCPESFDVILSLGVVEHLDNPEMFFSTCFDLLRDGGRVITVIPNFQGLNGIFQNLLDSALLAIHNRISPTDLMQLQTAFSQVKAFYWGSFDPTVARREALGSETLRWRVVGAVRKLALGVCCVPTWTILRLSGAAPESVFFSPYIASVGLR